ncbi:MAG: hypothetical protein HDT39_05450 [Lachnospiraceae bacterium]|nr:hypothetical protein [Lachnospiraceae bacterium]
MILLITILCICIFTGCGNKNTINTETETETETENHLFDQLEGVTKVTVISYGHEYVTEDEEALNRIVRYLKRAELELADNQETLYGEVSNVKFYSGEEEIMSIGSDNNRYLYAGDRRYERVSKEVKGTLPGIFRSLWEDYGK